MVPALAIRAIYPNRTNTSGIAGNIRYLNWVSTDEPLGAVAVTGSTFSDTPNTTISTIPDTNSGTVASVSPDIEMTRSTQRPANMAAITPPRIESGTTMMNASAASLSELTSAVPRKPPTPV